MNDSNPQVTQLLVEWRKGDDRARERLIPLVYDELRRIAGGFMKRERADHTLQPTALVNEAVLRFLDQKAASAADRAQLIGLAAQLMRRVLVDHARAKRAEKRGDGVRPVTIDQGLEPTSPEPRGILDIHDALRRLEKAEPRQARVVELRVFGGLEVTEVAQVMGTSPATVKRDWQVARGWLQRELGPGGGSEG